LKSLIGHNNPPKERKADWKSISINKWIYKDLQRIAENIRQHKNCFRLLEGLPPIEKVSIPYVIELMVTDKLVGINAFEIQDNGRNIWEQMEKRFLRTYNSKRGFNAK
jgi:hypothetical protein|tara:strand:+ start:166 stop:489 length:324 start_codon:yes stop_codon:yes gene_type:complete